MGGIEKSTSGNAEQNEAPDLASDMDATFAALLEKQEAESNSDSLDENEKNESKSAEEQITELLTTFNIEDGDNNNENREKSFNVKEEEKPEEAKNSKSEFQRIESTQQEREATVAGKEGEEKLNAEIRFTYDLLGRTSTQIRQETAALAITIDAEHMDEDQQTLAQQERTQLEEDLERYPSGITAFYEEYTEILQISDEHERSRRLVVLRQTLHSALNGPYPADGYDHADVEEVFRALTSTDQMQSYAFIVFQERLVLAMELDRSMGTEIAGAIEKEIARGSRSPDETLRRIDLLLSRVTEIAIEAVVDESMEELRAKLRKLDTLNRRAKAVSRVVDTSFAEKALNLFTRKTDAEETVQNVQAVAVAVQQGFDGLDDDAVALLSDHAQAGRSALVEGILEHPEKLEKTPEGYKGEMEGEEVHLIRRDGRLQAHLEHEGREIPIPNTSPPAIGFDLARSEKIAVANGWEDIVENAELRWLLMDNPNDSEFMDTAEATKFEDVLLVLIREPNIDAEQRLVELRILDAQGSVDLRYTYALKNELAKRAEGTTLSALKIEDGELTALVDTWHTNGGPPKHLVHP